MVRDLGGRGLTRERVLALGARLVDLGFFRVGDKQYTRTNVSCGLTTVRRDQVTCRSGEIGFDYPAKSGRQYSRELVDEESDTVAQALLRRQGGTDRLIEYGEGRRWHQVEGSDLNEHLHTLSGRSITTKGFRTWHATVLAAVALAVSAEVAKDSNGSPQARGLTRRAGSSQLPRQHTGRAPRLLHQPAPVRAVRRRGDHRSRTPGSRCPRPEGTTGHARSRREGRTAPAELNQKTVGASARPSSGIHVGRSAPAGCLRVLTATAHSAWLSRLSSGRASIAVAVGRKPTGFVVDR
ncbi:hypothetical protein ACFVS7_07925 [Streptomyces rubiginosohelvolus]|uniref:hypothetical protein n=1 Tax=Streptomyces rubiginosohelvolus TaxID=67362 RepID=UPI0036DEAB4B